MKTVFMTVLFLFTGLCGTHSHQPYLLMKTNFTQDHPYKIAEPVISKAFYGELKGSPDYYMVVPEKPMEFYINILTPDITNYNTNVFSVDVMVRTEKGDRSFFTLNGYGMEWERYYERFGKDWYRMGPETRIQLNTNTVYVLKIYSKSNLGRYALATGELESFPFWEILRIIGVLPELHRDFFNKK